MKPNAAIADTKETTFFIAQAGGTVGVAITKNVALEFGGNVIYLNHVPTAITGPSPDAMAAPSATSYLMYGVTAGLQVKF